MATRSVPVRQPKEISNCRLSSQGDQDRRGTTKSREPSTKIMPDCMRKGHEMKAEPESVHFSALLTIEFSKIQGSINEIERLIQRFIASAAVDAMVEIGGEGSDSMINVAINAQVPPGDKLFKQLLQMLEDAARNSADVTATATEGR